MENKLHTEPAKQYVYRRDFTLERDENGWISWQGAGRFEGDYCGFTAYRKAKEAAADAVFRLAIADGCDWSEAVMAVYMAKLPTDHLNLECLD